MSPSPGGLGTLSIVGSAWGLTLQGRQGRAGLRPPLTALLVVVAPGLAPVVVVPEAIGVVRLFPRS